MKQQLHHLKEELKQKTSMVNSLQKSLQDSSDDASQIIKDRDVRSLPISISKGVQEMPCGASGGWSSGEQRTHAEIEEEEVVGKAR